MTDESPPVTSAAVTGSDPARARADTKSVYLHIGTLKTGTSFLQHVLQRNSRLLAQEGMLYPLARGAWALQVRAARDILGMTGRPVDGGWDDLYGRIEAWPGRAAVVSMEFFSLANDVRARRVVEALQPFDVQIVVTARDLGRVLSSSWQSMVKQGHQWSFPDFVAGVRGGDVSLESHRRFWHHHDLPAIVGRWADAAGTANVHLVTVPPSTAPADVLWQRFCAVIGVTADRYDISQGQQSNFSLSYSDTEFMRRVSAAVEPQISHAAFKRWATRYLANRVLRADAATRTTTDRALLGADTQRWAIERSRQMVQAIEALGVPVVGDLSDLIPVATDAPETEAEVRPQEEYPDRSVLIIAALVRKLAETDPEHQQPTETAADSDEDDDLAEADATEEELVEEGADDALPPASGPEEAGDALAPASGTGARL